MLGMNQGGQPFWRMDCRHKPLVRHHCPIMSSCTALRLPPPPPRSPYTHAQFWKARLALDKRLAGLLDAMDGQWLGPWRCLLAKPLPAAAGGAGSALPARAVLQEAAQRFVGEHFEFVFGKWSVAAGWGVGGKGGSVRISSCAFWLGA